MHKVFVCVIFSLYITQNVANEQNVLHRRKSSLSLNLDEVNRFEADLKEAVAKVSDLTAKFEVFQTVVGQGESAVISLNLEQQKEIQSLKKDLETSKKENESLKKQVGKYLAEKFNRDDKTGKEEEKKGGDPFEKYKREIKLGMPLSKVVEKMKNDGLTDEAIEKFKKEQSKNKGKFADDPLEKFERMRKLGLPMHVIENKMIMEGIDKKLIEEFKNRMHFLALDFFPFFIGMIKKLICKIAFV